MCWRWKFRMQDMDTLRSLADKFREKYPENGTAVLDVWSQLSSLW